MTENPDGDRLLVSYLTLRRVIGVLGVALPVVLAVWGFLLTSSWELQESISDYYGLRTRDAFVGILFVIGWFLFAYRGYDRRDDRAGDLGCIFALGVALFPNSGARLESTIHFTSAALLFLVLAYFSIFLFTKSSGTPTPRKRIRNVVYRACGGVILGAIALIGVYNLLPAQPRLAALKPVFWLETIALWAFGTSWFVKGETLLKDTL
jgi:hypothetical protein